MQFMICLPGLRHEICLNGQRVARRLHRAQVLGRTAILDSSAGCEKPHSAIKTAFQPLQLLQLMFSGWVKPYQQQVCPPSDFCGVWPSDSVLLGKPGYNKAAFCADIISDMAELHNSSILQSMRIASNSKNNKILHSGTLGTGLLNSTMIHILSRSWGR